MDTKWKKSNLIKFLSFALAVVMAFVLAFSVIQCCIAVSFVSYGDGDVVHSFVNLLENGRPDFFDCSQFQYRTMSKIASMDMVFVDTAELRKQLEVSKKQEIERVVSQYETQKANIIRRELEYIAQNYGRQDYYGESIYNENGYSEILESSIPDTPYEEQKYIIDHNASKTVQMVQKILNYAEGKEFLKYASLVRREAFNESEFLYSVNVHLADRSWGWDGSIQDYTASADEVKTKFESQISSYFDAEVSSYEWEIEDARNSINNLVNLKYYVKKGDKTFTNMNNPSSEIATIKDRRFYMVKQDGKMLFEPGCVDADARKIALETFEYEYWHNDFEQAAYYVDEEINYLADDNIADAYNEYKNIPENFKLTFIMAIVSLVLLIVICISAFTCAGHKKGESKCVISVIDKFPIDLHLALVGGLIVGTVILSDSFLRNFYYETVYTVPVISIAVTVIFALVLEFALSVVRIKKAKQSIIKSCIVIKILCFIFKMIAKLFKRIYSGIKKAFFSYKMKHLKKKFLLVAIGLVFLNVICLFFFAAGFVDFEPFFAIVSGAIVLVADGFAIFFTAKYMNALDKIIVAATERTSASFGGERVPDSLDTLNDSLKVTKEEMESAVAVAIKNERTKTELITNVSHDLKTPLTSVISYVDLLKKCDIKNEDALKYIDVLSDKSQNLKSLIENLIEASKASTGNIKINKVYLNLKELSAQAICEFASDFEARGLELKFRENEENVRIFADGPHTYRVLENLLSNAKKYSAPGTRVYASTRREGDFGVFEIKNISKNPLDISPDELTERFVRGDSSRGTEEGNGLGLSIAKQLCTLQGGELKLTIDGDLFKAEVYLPVN